MLFIVGLFTASQTRKLKLQNKESVKKAYRTEILLENSQKLRRCKSEKEVWQQAAAQVEKLLDLSLVIYPVNKDGLLGEAMLFPRQGTEKISLEPLLTSQEKAVANGWQPITTGQEPVRIRFQQPEACTFRFRMRSR